MVISILARIFSSSPPAASAVSSLAGLEPEAAILAQRIRTARAWFAQEPSQFSAQMGLLTDEDWILGVNQHPLLDTFKSPPQAGWNNELGILAIELDQQATADFNPALQSAFRRFSAASDGRLPAKLDELLPFFEPAIDPKILESYALNGRTVIGRHGGTVPRDGYKFRGPSASWTVDIEP